MREIPTEQVIEAVKTLCIKSNLELPCDLKEAIVKAKEKETSSVCQSVLDDMQENLKAARKLTLPICQDTGMAVVFAEVGQEVHLKGGSFTDAVNQGVREGYQEGHLRKSVVQDPFRRENTGDNTPAILHITLVPGNQVKLTVAPKGFGSENMSALRMFTPAATKEDVIKFIVHTVKQAGSNPCPPVVVGVGIGGDFELCAMLAKKALCRPISKPNSDPYYAGMEAELLEQINRLGIGAQGFGGDVSSFGVQVESYPTHIASLPVAVNIGCHVTRHQTMTL